MREVKFRAWDKKRRKMFFVNTIEGMLQNTIYMSKSGDMELYEDEAELMQYTGLKDRNEHEIYEGDIVRMNPEDDNWDDVVVFQDGKFELKSCMDPYGGFHLAVWCYGSSNPGLIVGNIHENPELLRSEDEV